MNIDHIIFSQPISAIWTALGGDAPRRGRVRAFYRKGDNPDAVSLNDEKGCWHDFVTEDGGGVLDLVQHVRGCTRGEAVRWLAELHGLPLDGDSLSKAERTRYARARRRAPALAQDLADWTRGLYLIAQRDVITTGALVSLLLDHDCEPGHVHRNAVNRLLVLRAATPHDIAAVYADARHRDSRAVAAIVRLGSADREHAARLTRAIVNLLAMAEVVAA
jgi:hypothetical protein